MTSKKQYPDFTDRKVDTKTPLTIIDPSIFGQVRELSVKMGWSESAVLDAALMSFSSDTNRERGYDQTIINGKVTYTKLKLDAYQKNKIESLPRWNLSDLPKYLRKTTTEEQSENPKS